MSPFHLFHLFIDWSELVGVACLLAGVVGLCFSLFCLVADQSLRSSCLPMTNLAQLHDCHSCYDERSIDQKKPYVGTQWGAVSAEKLLPAKRSRSKK